MRLVIIGGVAAGSKAAAKARRVNADLDIIIYQQEAEVSYSACGEPYLISGVIADSQQLLIRTPGDFAQDRIPVFTEHRVETIDHVNKRLMVRDLKTQHCFTDFYDRLIIATGARPIIPNINGIHLTGVLVLRSWTDLQTFCRSLSELKPRTALIIGAGYISLELAEALTKLNISTTIAARGQRLLSTFDSDMTALVRTHLQENGVSLRFNTRITELIGRGQRVTGVTTTDGEFISADLVIFAIGIQANVELAEQTGITLGKTGAIQVDTQMATNLNDIYAAGDCCETLNRITGTASWQPLGDIANLQGRVAGENAAGGNAYYQGSFGTSILKAFDFNIAITGLSEHAAKQHGFMPLSVTVTAMDKARYYPNAHSSQLKLVADTDGRLLGAQAVGKGASDKLIDIAATALLGNLNCADLEYADFAYSPPFSPVLSPISVAASVLISRIKKAGFKSQVQF
jgi:NADPH-dependent 2,4-dienoyl-CoA reductase/sulfur reductase-like enzyme